MNGIPKDLSVQAHFALWAANHNVGDKETLKGGHVLERTETGWTLHWAQPIELVTIAGRIET